MDVETVRAYCLSFPHVTEEVLWGNDLVFKIGGKMFAVIGLDPASGHCMSFKCTPEQFAELTEEDGIDPAPYVARYHWVALERFNALREKELKALLSDAYDLVLEKLPKKTRAERALRRKLSESAVNESHRTPVAGTGSSAWFAFFHERETSSPKDWKSTPKSGIKYAPIDAPVSIHLTVAAKR